MPIEYSPPASEPVNPEILINELNLAALSLFVEEGRYRLVNGSQGGWRDVARHARTQREEIITDAATYVLTPETPPFHSQEPEALDAYFADARRARSDDPQLATNAELVPERGVVAYWVDEYLRDPANEQHIADLRQDGRYEGFRTFLIENTLGITVTGRAIAWRSFEVRRNRILREELGILSVFPLLTKYSKDREEIRRLPITHSQATEARRRIEQLPSTTPYPDFFQMDPHDQRMISFATCSESAALFAFLEGHLGRRFFVRDQGRAPLAHQPLAALQRAITAVQDVAPAELCRAFLRSPHPQHFRNRVVELRRETRAASAERRALLRAGFPGERLAANLTPNQQAMGALLLDPQVSPDIVQMTLGDTVRLSRPATGTERAEIVRPSHLDSIIQKNLELLGRHIYELLPDTPTLVNLLRWDGVNLADVLTAGFSGTITNFTMQVLPVSQEDLHARLPGTDLQADEVVEVILAVDMQSSGRPVNPAALRLMLAVRFNEKRGSIHKTTWRPRSSGAEVVAALHLESTRIARGLESRNLRHPLYMGASGLGKRR